MYDESMGQEPTEHNSFSAIELNQKPAWSLKEFCFMSGLPLSSMQALLAANEAPMFKLGRRLFILRDDAVEWIYSMARANPVPRVRRRKSRGA